MEVWGSNLMKSHSFFIFEKNLNEIFEPVKSWYGDGEKFNVTGLIRNMVGLIWPETNF